MAVTDANLSQYMASAGAVVALVSPLHGAILGVGAGMMGVCGNYRQAVANDPPRDDFGEVWVSGAVLDENALPAEEPSRTLVRFAAHQMLVMDALYALLRSLEGHDGAVNAQDFDAADVQADAVRQNANLAADLQETLISIGRDMNETIAGLRADGPGFDAWPSTRSSNSIRRHGVSRQRALGRVCRRSPTLSGARQTTCWSRLILSRHTRS